MVKFKKVDKISGRNSGQWKKSGFKVILLNIDVKAILLNTDIKAKFIKYRPLALWQQLLRQIY